MHWHNNAELDHMARDQIARTREELRPLQNDIGDGGVGDGRDVGVRRADHTRFVSAKCICNRRGEIAVRLERLQSAR